MRVVAMLLLRSLANEMTMMDRKGPNQRDVKYSMLS